MAEHLTYAPLKQMAHHLDLRLQPLAMDEQGLTPDDLDRACRTTSAKVLYCLPTLHTPTTATLPEGRRRAVAEVARAHDLTIIEDDVFGFLPRERPPPVARFAPERSLFVTSVSKSLAPGLRIGYLRAPETYRRAVDQAVALSCLMPAPLMAEIACRWIADGTADRLNARQRREAQARQEIAGRILARHAYRADPFGFSLWLPLPPPWRAETFRMEAERRGVKVLTGEIFAVGQTAAPHAVRLCLGYEPDRARVTAGLETVADLLEGQEGAGSSVV
jgi:DNA-binding transcriptional MocR family regulator